MKTNFKSLQTNTASNLLLLPRSKRSSLSLNWMQGKKATYVYKKKKNTFGRDCPREDSQRKVKNLADLNPTRTVKGRSFFFNEVDKINISTDIRYSKYRWLHIECCIGSNSWIKSISCSSYFRLIASLAFSAGSFYVRPNIEETSNLFLYSVNETEKWTVLTFLFHITKCFKIANNQTRQIWW